MGPLVGLRAGSDLVSRFGVEASLQLAMSNFQFEVSPATPKYPERQWREHVLLLGLRGVARLTSPNSTLQVRLHGGPAVLGFSDYWLAFDQIHVAGNIGVGIAQPLGRRLDLTVDVDNFVYRYNNRDPRQQDLAVAFGLRLRPPIGR
jgi:hypothetical protein